MLPAALPSPQPCKTGLGREQRDEEGLGWGWQGAPGHHKNTKNVKFDRRVLLWDIHLDIKIKGKKWGLMMLQYIAVAVIYFCS